MSNAPEDPREESDLQDLLRTVGTREVPPQDAAREVRAAVYEEWRALLAQRSRRRWRTFSAAASIAVASLLIATFAIRQVAPAQDAALAARIEGTVTRDSGLFYASAPLAAGESTRVGDTIETAAGARAAFETPGGVSFRLDERTRVRLLARDRLNLQTGAVYVDADPRMQASESFAVETRNGIVRHLGTQYEVRASDGAIQVSVREGLILIDRGGALLPGQAGERLALQADGTIERSTIAHDDPQWHWIHQVAPRFDIDNQPLEAFLRWFSRETGTVVSFAHPSAEQAARETLLRGSIEGLEPLAALAAVLATTNLNFEQTNDGKIVIQTSEP